MPVVHLEEHIAATPAAVWEALALRYGELDRWLKVGATSRLVGEGPVGLGTARTVKAGPLLLTETIVAFEDERHLAYQIEGLGPIVRSCRTDWKLTASDTGTRVSMHNETHVAGWPVLPAVFALLGPVNRRLLGKLPTGLKEHCERG